VGPAVVPNVKKPTPPRVDIELRIEDGVCITRRILNTGNVPTFIAPESSIVRKWRDMTDDERREFVKVVTGMDAAITPPVRNDWVAVGSGSNLGGGPNTALNLLTSLNHRSQNLASLEAIREKFPRAETVEVCNLACAELPENARWVHHIHARLIGDVDRIIPMYVYGLQDYIMQRDVPVEIVDVLREAGAPAYEVATPEFIAILSRPAIRDPLLFALTGFPPQRYVIWQWE